MGVMSQKKTRKGESRDRSRSVSGAAARGTDVNLANLGSAPPGVHPGAGSAMPWFYHMAYRQYWDHLRHVQTWLKATKYARKKAEVDGNKTLHQLEVGRLWHNPFGGFMTGMADAMYPPSASSHLDPAMASKEHHGPKRGEKRTLRKRRSRRKTEKVRDDWSDQDVEEEEMAKEDEEGGNVAEVEESAFDATCDDQEEFLKLLKQNQAFREQRDAYKRREEESARRKEMISSQTPKEQAGAKRTREMAELYGSESLLIQTLETSLQMKFDEYADSNQPALWPSLPLNLHYGR